MSQIITNRIPPKQWITDAVHSHFTGHGWGPIAIVVDDESRDDVIIMVALPQQVNPQGATAVAKFLVIGTKAKAEVATYSDVDLQVHIADGQARFTYKDGTNWFGPRYMPHNNGTR